MRRFRRISIGIVLIFIALGMAGCAGVGVDVWERDILAKPEMQPTADAYDRALDDHIYFSKEASSGGRTTAGGGCGCN